MKKYNDKRLCKGILFIKSMMSISNVNKKKELDQENAFKAGIVCEKKAMEDGRSGSVDRPPMSQLVEILETADYDVLVVEDIYELTQDPQDLRVLMDRINGFGVIIFDLSTMSARYNNYTIEC